MAGQTTYTESLEKLVQGLKAARSEDILIEVNLCSSQLEKSFRHDDGPRWLCEGIT